MRFRCLLGCAAACALGAGAALAAPPRSAPRAPETMPRAPEAMRPPPAPRTERPASLEQAVKQVQRDTRGHILAADTLSRGRTQVYRIKVLRPDGKVQVLQLHSSPRASGRAGSSESEQGGH